MANNEIVELSIQKLFEGDCKYQIPIYQRNYAWTKTEVEQLIMDINDYVKENSETNTKNYYIGTLVVFQKNINGKKVFETIDGQQRLTTLSVLLSVLKNEFEKEITFNHLLEYESREISTKTLACIYDGSINKIEDLNYAMENAYKVLKNALKDIDIDEFVKYLLNNVKILRVNVPQDTDLNHYFEIMNNRGEQLEKHEVLKARMLKKLNNNDEKKVFNDIWEACSDMYRYVQYGFIPNKRESIFGKNWDSFICKDFTKIVEIINQKSNLINDQCEIEGKETATKEDFTIDEILNGECIFENDKNKNQSDDKPDRFTSPINFPNFLLHVLKITKENTTPLDDKRLLDTFKDYNEQFVKDFGYNLLKMRFLFDNYVIKREYTGDKDRWSLLQAYKYKNEKNSQENIQYKNRFEDIEKNEQILMILSMFHVSNPSQIYKYWLTGVLNYLFNHYETEKLSADLYIEYLEKLAKSFLKNRYLAIEAQEFENIIFEKTVKVNNSINVEKLDQGTSVEHFIFNYLDYLLWKNKKNDKENYNYFSFSFSNSVEHFYPQNPREGHVKITDEKILNSFGNLCLISVSKNAKLNNHPPKSKKEYYPNNQYDSLKQHTMMTKADEWNEETIEIHKNEMLEILGLTT